MWEIVSKLLILLSSVEDLTEHMWGIVSKLLIQLSSVEDLIEGS